MDNTVSEREKMKKKNGGLFSFEGICSGYGFAERFCLKCFIRLHKRPRKLNTQDAGPYGVVYSSFFLSNYFIGDVNYKEVIKSTRWF